MESDCSVSNHEHDVSNLDNNLISTSDNMMGYEHTGAVATTRLPAINKLWPGQSSLNVANDASSVGNNSTDGTSQLTCAEQQHPSSHANEIVPTEDPERNYYYFYHKKIGDIFTLLDDFPDTITPATDRPLPAVSDTPSPYHSGHHHHTGDGHSTSGDVVHHTGEEPSSVSYRVSNGASFAVTGDATGQTGVEEPLNIYESLIYDDPSLAQIAESSLDDLCDDDANSHLESSIGPQLLAEHHTIDRSSVNYDNMNLHGSNITTQSDHLFIDSHHHNGDQHTIPSMLDRMSDSHAGQLNIETYASNSSASNISMTPQAQQHQQSLSYPLHFDHHHHTHTTERHNQSYDTVNFQNSGLASVSSDAMSNDQRQYPTENHLSMVGASDQSSGAGYDKLSVSIKELQAVVPSEQLFTYDSRDREMSRSVDVYTQLNNETSGAFLNEEHNRMCTFSGDSQNVFPTLPAVSGHEAEFELHHYSVKDNSDVNASAQFVTNHQNTMESPNAVQQVDYGIQQSIQNSNHQNDNSFRDQHVHSGEKPAEVDSRGSFSSSVPSQMINNFNASVFDDRPSIDLQPANNFTIGNHDVSAMVAEQDHSNVPPIHTDSRQRETFMELGAGKSSATEVNVQAPINHSLPWREIMLPPKKKMCKMASYEAAGTPVAPSATDPAGTGSTTKRTPSVVCGRGKKCLEPGATKRHCSSDALQENVKDVRKQLRNGCGCVLNCFRGLKASKVLQHRQNIGRLTTSELYMYLMGLLRACMNNSVSTGSKKRRQRVSIKYFRQGRRLCFHAFKYLENVGKRRLMLIEKHMCENGVKPFRHGNSGKQTANKTPATVYQPAVDFVNEFLASMKSGSGNHSGEKPVHIPPRVTRIKLFEFYSNHCRELEAKSIGYTTFRTMLKQRFAHLQFSLKEIAARNKKTTVVVARKKGLSKSGVVSSKKKIGGPPAIES